MQERFYYTVCVYIYIYSIYYSIYIRSVAVNIHDTLSVRSAGPVAALPCMYTYILLTVRHTIVYI